MTPDKTSASEPTSTADPATSKGDASDSVNSNAGATAVSSAANTVTMETCGEEKAVPPASFCRAVIARWKSATESLRQGVSHVILVMAHHSATNPIICIVASCLLSVSLLGIGYATNFDMNVKGSDYLTPVKSVIWEQRAWIADESNFPEKPHSLRVLIHKNGDNVLSMEGINKTFDVLDKVQETNGYQELCIESEETNSAGYGGLCHIRGANLLWNQSRQVFGNKVSSNVDLLLQISVTKFPDGADIDRRELMGHWTLLNGTIGGRDIIESAESFLMEVSVPAALDRSKAIAVAVLEDLQELQLEWDAGTTGYHLEVYLVDHSLEAETIRAVFHDLPLIVAVFVVMAIFTCLAFSFSNKPGSDLFQPRFLLGFGAVVTILISLMTSYGLMFIIGVPFTSLTQILPFIMFGIGLDDSFIIYGEFIRTDATKDPVDRIRDTFEEVSLSCFLTSLTTSLAFALGCTSSIPTLIWLSLYAFPTVIIDFIFQITLFVAILVVDERRIMKQKALKEEKQKASQKPGERGSNPDQVIDLDLGMEEAPEPHTTSDGVDSDGTVNTRDHDKQVAVKEEIHYHHHSPGPPVSAADRFMKWYANILLTTPAKIFVLMGFVAVSSLLVFAASNFRQQFNIYEVLASDSYVTAFFKSMEAYTDSGFVVPQVYFRNVDQSDPEVQVQMQAFVDDLVNETDSITKPPPYFWLAHFKEFLTYDDRLLDLTFNQQMNIFLSIDVFRTLYGDHIVRDENGDIEASRVTILMDNVDMADVHNQIQAWREQMNVTKHQPLNAKEHHVDGYGFNFFLQDDAMLFGWEFYAAFVNELIGTSIVGVVVVSFVTCVFLPHWSAVFILTPLLSLLFIDLIGFLQLCGVSLNAISYFTLVMSIGLTVDFNMHILLMFYESPCTTSEGKVKDALQTMGSSIVLGGLSTFLGVVPLLFSSSSLMKNLFYGFWGMVIIGCGHGVIVLPVILSCLGPLGTVPTVPSNPTTLSIPDPEQLNVCDSQSEKASAISL